MYPRNVLAYLEKHAYIAPNKLAAEDEHEACCYEDLKNRCQSIGTALTKRIAYGAPVAVVMEKGIPALSAFWGIVYAGGYYVLLNPDLPVPRLKQVQSVLRADYVITDRLHMEIAQGLISPDERACRRCVPSGGPGSYDRHRSTVCQLYLRFHRRAERRCRLSSFCD